MRHLTISGQVIQIVQQQNEGGQKTGFVVELHEKVWNGEKNEIIIWDVHLDQYTGEKLQKAHVQIKYFGFQCDNFKINYEYIRAKDKMNVWWSARGRSFFTL